MTGRTARAFPNLFDRGKVYETCIFRDWNKTWNFWGGELQEQGSWLVLISPLLCTVERFRSDTTVYTVLTAVTLIFSYPPLSNTVKRHWFLKMSYLVLSFKNFRNIFYQSICRNRMVNARLRVNFLVPTFRKHRRVISYPWRSLTALTTRQRSLKHGFNLRKNQSPVLKIKFKNYTVVCPLKNL